MNITDPTAALNALKTDKVDVVEVLDPAGQRLVEDDDNLQVLLSDSGGWQPFVMNTQAAPFDNPDVRKAVRLLANREQLLVAAQGGQGKVGNDLFSPFDPMYASSHPAAGVRPEQAKALLQGAGVDKLVLHTGAVGSGHHARLRSPSRRPARRPGSPCETKVVPADSYWNVVWLKEPFFVSGWANRSFASTYGIALAPNAPQPETGWKLSRTGTRSSRRPCAPSTTPSARSCSARCSSGSGTTAAT